jgi:hypothetical protein
MVPKVRELAFNTPLKFFIAAKADWGMSRGVWNRRTCGEGRQNSVNEMNEVNHFWGFS